MGTRSRIGVMHGDKLKSVYCHWDGYLSHNGQLLQDHYDSPKANHLVALGDISSLGKHIGEAHPFSQFEINKDDIDFDKLIALHDLAKKEGWTTFYNRDRGETGVDFQVAQSYDEFQEQCNNCDAEYHYIMKDGVWYVGVGYERDSMVPGQLYVLAEQLAKETEEV
jgi:hypothetical protein